MKPNRNRDGFTLVELLTVIAIITLLIGILVPALSSSRDQAKKVRTRAQLQAIETGNQMFQGDNDAFPASSGLNPFQDATANIPLSGAQWISLQLAGFDQGGYVSPTVGSDYDNNRLIDHNDWRDWYGLTPAREYGRLGPYIEVDGSTLRSPERFLQDNTNVEPPDALMLDPAGDDFSSGRIPFFVDSFNQPILYYRANAKVRTPFTTGTRGSSFDIGKYDHSDNALFTGADEANGLYADVIGTTDGWDVSGRGSLPVPGAGVGLHPIGVFGYDAANPNKWPEPGTFGAYMSDRNVFDTTYRPGSDGGQIVPYKPDRFVLISAGKDGLYGTSDDVRNFEPSTK